MIRTSTLLPSISANNDNETGNLIVVMYRLPILASRKEGSNEWDFKFDDDALYLTFQGLNQVLHEPNKNGTKKEVIWFGILNLDVDLDIDEQEEIDQKLWDDFRCVPVWIDKCIRDRFYYGFCKGILWPMLHMVDHVPRKAEDAYDETLWQDYKRVNLKFKQEIVGRVNQEQDAIWIHDYHLMLLPSRLRSRLSVNRIGFFLHTPWPSSEAYRALPWNEDLRNGMLGSSILGFHMYDYARHFLSACQIEYKRSRGSLIMVPNGRTVTIRVSHIGVHPERFRSFPRSEGTADEAEIARLEAELVEELGVANKCVFGAIDDLDIVKGISLKLMAFETFLANNPDYREKVKLVQFALRRPHANKKAEEEIERWVDRINSEYGTPTNRPVEYRVKSISLEMRVALYRILDALVLLPIRDGLNLVPYEYIMSKSDEKPARMILSESTGCSRALSLTVRVNPFDKKEIAKRMLKYVQSWESTSQEDNMARHRANVDYVQEHSTRDWAKSFLEDIENMSISESGRDDFKEKHLTYNMLEPAYRKSNRRLFLLDYDGTLQETTGSQESRDCSPPSEKVALLLSSLAGDPKNKVYVLSGRLKDQLEQMFVRQGGVGLAAEHGFHYRMLGESEWKNQMETIVDSLWKDFALEKIKEIKETAPDSYVDEKESAIVWHYVNDDFGMQKAHEMYEALDPITRAHDVHLLRGDGWLQVRLNGVSKRSMVERVLRESYNESEQPEFIFCAGDDMTDDDMFQAVSEYSERSTDVAYFNCVVGTKMFGSYANYNLRNSSEVISLLFSMS